MKTTSLSLLLVLAIFVVACGQASPTPIATTTSASTATQPPTAIPAATVTPGDSERSLTVNGLARTYLLHIPPGLNAGDPTPLVFVFHGLGEAANLIMYGSGMNATADANGFIVVYPNGSGSSGAQSWNAGDCCGYAHLNNVDDTAFVRQIMADVSTLASIDPKRTYASGFSNGALLSYRLACDMSDTFAAVAPVAGVLLYEQCQPKGPVAVIDLHGMSDNIVPYGGGGIIPDLGTPFPPVEDSIAAWAKFDGCTGSPQVEQGNIFTRTAYTSCEGGTAVELYAVKGIGHAWPSQYVVPANQIIWDFFKAHTKQ